jgi:hypothetical protein
LFDRCISSKGVVLPHFSRLDPSSAGRRIGCVFS